MIGPIQQVLDNSIVAKKEIARIRSGAIRKRGSIVTTLSDIHSDLTYATKLVKKNVYRAYEDVLTFRDSVKASATTCQSLSRMVQSKDIKPRELNERLTQVLSSLEADIKFGISITQYMTEADVDEDAEEGSKAASRDRRESAAASRSNRILKQLKDAHQHRVPTTFTKERLRFIQLPVMANFANFSVNQKSLAAMGFPVIAAGLHSTPSNDLGLIFENQLLMLFRQTDASSNAAERVVEARERDLTQTERKRLQKMRTGHRRELKELTALLESCSKKKNRAVIQEQLDEVQSDIDKLTLRLDGMNSDYKLSKSRERVLNNMVRSDEHVIIDYVAPIIDSINKKKGTNYTLLTARPLRGIMRDSDVVAVWLMEKSAVNLLLTHTNSDLKLQDWYLPWAKCG